MLTLQDHELTQFGAFFLLETYIPLPGQHIYIYLEKLYYLALSG